MPPLVSVTKKYFDLMTVVMLLAMLIVTGYGTGHARAAIEGTTCSSAEDASGGVFLAIPNWPYVGLQNLSLASESCSAFDSEAVFPWPTISLGGNVDNILVAINTVESDIVTNPLGVTVSWDATKTTNVLRDGAAYTTGTLIPTTTTSALSTTIQFDYGGNTYYFTVVKNAGSNVLQPFTVQAGSAPSTGASESTLLDDQQAFFTPMIINHQSGNMISGVSGNLDGLFNGSGVANSVSQDGFAYQLAGSDETSWNYWIKGSWSIYEAQDNSSYDGYIADVVGGVDYRLAEDLIVGVLGGYGKSDFDSNLSGTVGSFSSDGVHAGVYLGKRLAPDLLFDALVAYTGAEYDNNAGTTTSSFSANRVTIAAHLKGNIDLAMATLQPIIGFTYASEAQDGYTDSAAVAHGAQTVTAGSLSIGPKFIFHPISTELGMSEFWFAAKGEYDFSNQSTSTTSSLPSFDKIASARLQAGISTQNEKGVSLALQGDVSGLGSGEFIGYGATARLSVPF